MSALTSSNKGLLVQYDYCTGCHSCEVACKKELGLDEGQYGIKLFTYGPAKGKDDKWDFFFMPVPTDLCDMCEERLAAGKMPACVHNCQAKVMKFGDIEELAKDLAEIKKCVLYAPTVE